MFRKCIALLIAVSLTAVSQAGFWEYQSGSYSAEMLININNAGGNNLVEVNDIVRSVQRFTYLDSLGNTRTALAIGIAEVTTAPTGSGSAVRSFLFGAPTDGVAGGEVTSVSELVNAIGTTLDSTGATGVTSDVWALISTSGDVSLSTAGFNFTAANFGLTTGSWQVDATAAFQGTSSYLEYNSAFIGAGATPSLDPVTYPDGSDVQDGAPTTFSQQFAYTYTGVNDANNEYTAGSGGFQTYTTALLSGTGTATGNVVSDSDTLLKYVNSTGSINQDFSVDSVAVTFAAPGAVPEPAALAIMSLVGVAGVLTRRRR